MDGERRQKTPRAAGMYSDTVLFRIDSAVRYRHGQTGRSASTTQRNDRTARDLPAYRGAVRSASWRDRTTSLCERHHGHADDLPTAMGHPQRPHRQPSRHRHRQHRPQRRAEDDRRAARRPGREPEPAGMGDQLLHPGIRRAAVHLRGHRRPDRPQAHAHDRPGPVRDRLAAVRLLPLARSADLRARGDGPGRRGRHAADAVDHLQRFRAAGAGRGPSASGPRPSESASQSARCSPACCWPTSGGARSS